MVYLYVSKTSIDISGQQYEPGQLYGLIFQQPSGVFPTSDRNLFEEFAVDNIELAKSMTGGVSTDENDQTIYSVSVDEDKLETVINEKIRQALTKITVGYENRMSALAVGKYSQAERDSFSEKLVAARVWKEMDESSQNQEIDSFELDPLSYATDLAILFTEIGFTGDATNKRQQVTDLANSIEANNMAWRRLIGTLTKDRKTMTAQIESTPYTVEGLESLQNFEPVWSV